MKTKLAIITFMLLASSVIWGQPRTEFVSKVKQTPALTIPDEAKNSGLTGQIIARVSLGKEGQVISVDSVSGPGPVCREVTRADVVALRRVARDAAKLAVFDPMIEDGNPQRAMGFVYFDIPPGATGSTDEGRVLRLGPLGAETNDGSENFLKRTAINLPKPEYPPAAKAIKATGPVSVKILIDENGEVFSSQAVSGHPLLRSAAAQTACKAKFKPTVSEGSPVKVDGVITFVFRP